MMIRKTGLALMGLGCAFLLATATARAEQPKSERSIAIIHADNDLSAPYHSARIGGMTDDIIRITPNKSKIIRLERDAASIVVSNPTHASVILDTPRVLVIIPRVPGATSFTVLDSSGNLILERDVVVTGTENNYIHVRRICGQDDKSCAGTSVYFCPDACYEVATEATAKNTGAGSGSGGGGSGGGSAGGYAGSGETSGNSEGSEE